MADDLVGGVSYVSVDGYNLTLGQGQHNIDLGMTEVESVPALSGGAAGFIERGKVPFIEVEGLNTVEQRIEYLQGIRNAKVVSELANGKIAVLRGARVAGSIAVDANAGTMAIRFEGKSGEWIE